MVIVKRLHRFILSSFLPLFAMTFLIVLFIVLMQFLWKYIDDLVGKGLSVDVLGELFFYAAVSMVPMALPLAILLASLMTFGNLGEKFELTAMKAAGLSLVRVMAPLIVLISAVAVGAFFFQNDVLPKAQVKMWTLLFSVRQKSPELEIPEGVFYDQIPGYNLFVREKDRDTGMLYDVMIYAINQGSDNSTILLADSAKMSFGADMQALYLHLWSGEQFENLREQRTMDRNVPFRREEFKDKQILIPFDANFNRLDDSSMRKQYVGKNMAELNQTIDSVSGRVDSIANILKLDMRCDLDRNFMITPTSDRRYAANFNSYYGSRSVRQSARISNAKPDDQLKAIYNSESISVDTLLAHSEESDRRNLLQTAVDIARDRYMQSEFQMVMLEEEVKSIRRHTIELMKKFTLSMACLVFFFIGAPLGAIIRKGGLGTPLVISVCLFLVYYFIDNTGYKLARDGHWPVWAGIWLSTFVLAPLGIYLTYKAMNDSAVFDKDAYIRFFQRLTGTRSNRKVDFKEIVINDISLSGALECLQTLESEAQRLLAACPKRQSYASYWLKGYDNKKIQDFSTSLDETVTYLSDSRNRLFVNKLMDFPVLPALWIYHPSDKRWLSLAMMIIFPLGLPIWLIGLRAQKRLRDELNTVIAVCGQLRSLLTNQVKD